MPMKDRKLYDQLRRQRIKSDPEQAKLWRERMHENYLRKKLLGRVKLASQMTDPEKLEQRKKWKETSRLYRTKKKANHVNNDHPLGVESSFESVNGQEVNHFATVDTQSPPVSPTAGTSSTETPVNADCDTEQLHQICISSTSKTDQRTQPSSGPLYETSTSTSCSGEVDRSEQSIQKLNDTALSRLEKERANLCGNDDPLKIEPLETTSVKLESQSVACNSKESSYRSNFLSSIKDKSYEKVLKRDSVSVVQTEGTGEHAVKRSPGCVNIRSESIVSGSNNKVEMHEKVLLQTCALALMSAHTNDSSSEIIPVVKAESNDDELQHDNIMEATVSSTNTVSECIVPAVKIERKEDDEDGRKVHLPPPTSNTFPGRYITDIKVEINQNGVISPDMHTVFDSDQINDELPEDRTMETESLQLISEKDSPTIPKNDELNTQVTDLMENHTNQKWPSEPKIQLMTNTSRSKAASISAALSSATIENEEKSPSSSKKMVAKQKSRNTMEKVIEVVKKKEIILKKASLVFDISSSTLRRIIQQKVTPKATNEPEKKKKMWVYKQSLPEALEKKLVSFCLYMERALISLTQKELAKAAFDLAKKHGIQSRFNEDYEMAGKGWLNRFLNKYQDQLSSLVSNSISQARKGDFFRESALQFFDRLESITAQTHFPPHRQYNVYECGLAIAQVNEVEIVKLLGECQVKSLSVTSKGTLVVIMMSCMNAVDDFVPPLVILPGAPNAEGMKNGAPPGTILRTDTTHWVKADIFLEWLRHFINHTKPSQYNPVLLVLDGSYTHIRNLEIVDLARENFITLVSLPLTRATSKKLQPVDKAFIFPFRSYFREELRRIVIQNKRALTYHDVMGPLGIAYAKCQTPKIAEYGFKVCGIYPFNRGEFDDKQPKIRKGLKTVDSECRGSEQDLRPPSPQEDISVKLKNTDYAADEPTASELSHPKNFEITSNSDSPTNAWRDTQNTSASIQQEKTSGAVELPTVNRQQTEGTSSDMPEKLVNVKQENASSAAEGPPVSRPSSWHISMAASGEPLLSHSSTSDLNDKLVKVELENTSCAAVQPPQSRLFSCLTSTSTNKQISPSCSPASELQEKLVKVKPENTSSAAVQPPQSRLFSCLTSKSTTKDILPSCSPASELQKKLVKVEEETSSATAVQPPVSRLFSYLTSTTTSNEISSNCSSTSELQKKLVKVKQENTSCAAPQPTVSRLFSCPTSTSSSSEILASSSSTIELQENLASVKQENAEQPPVGRISSSRQSTITLSQPPGSNYQKSVKVEQENSSCAGAQLTVSRPSSCRPSSVTSEEPSPRATLTTTPSASDNKKKPYQKYQIAVVKKEVLDGLIEVKYEGVEDTDPLYPFVQLDTSPEEHQFPDHDSSEPPLKRMREDGLDDCLLDEVECLPTDVFVDNPMADDAEDDARAFGDYVTAEMSRIRSDERRKMLKKTIEEAIKAMVQEDEQEYFQDPDVDPLG